MSPKWIVFILTAWLLTALLAGVAENAYMGAGVVAATGEPVTTSVFNTLMTSSKLSPEFWGAVFAMARLDFPGIFYGAWGIFRWIFFATIGIAFTISFILAAVRGTSSG